MCRRHGRRLAGIWTFTTAGNLIRDTRAARRITLGSRACRRCRWRHERAALWWGVRAPTCGSTRAHPTRGHSWSDDQQRGKPLIEIETVSEPIRPPLLLNRESDDHYCMPLRTFWASFFSSKSPGAAATALRCCIASSLRPTFFSEIAK